ncbi:MAG: tetratricopeptide repeat protein [Candidatus Aureabacteria bacterium]|nr:tetratricopeptide repeat protein [Candidatus Auribacterota bacterium]
MRSTRNFLVLSLLILLSAAVYSPTFLNRFVYDDQVTVEENLFIRDWKNVARFFSADYYVRAEEYSFRPLVTLTYFWDYSFWGTNPWGYHLTNLLLHAFAAVTVYFLALRLFRRRLAAAAAALLFALHPGQTEAVAGISFREDLLCALFCFLSFLCYLRTKRSCIFIILSVLFFILALLAKEMAAAFPLVLLAWEFPRKPDELRKPGRRSPALRLLPFFVAAALYALLRFRILYQQGTLPTAPEFGDPLARIFLAFKSLGFYGRLAFFPFNLTVEYPDPFPALIWGNYLLLPALLIAAFFLRALVGARSGSGAKFGAAFFLLSLLPVLNLIPSSRLGAERFFYLPALGFCLWFAGVLFPRRKDTDGDRVGGGRIVWLAVILACFSLQTIKRNREWESNLVLFSRAVAVSPGSSKARHGLGNELFRLRRLPEAEKELRAAIDIFSREPLYHNSLGVVYGEMGDYKKSLAEFLASARLNPGDPLVLMNLSTLYLRLGDTDKALQEIEMFIAARPFDAKGYLNLGEIRINQKDYPRAIAAYRRALELDPYSLLALGSLGYCYYQTKDYLSARRAWEAALRLDPNNPEIRRNLDSLRRMGL